MDERSLLTLLQKRPNEGMKELMRQYMGYCLLHCEKQAVGISAGRHRGMCE